MSALAMAGLMVAATGLPAAAADSKVLNIFNWTEYMPDSVIQGFEKKYDVKVNYDTYSSNEEMLAKLQAGASGYDLVVPSGYMVDILQKQHLLDTIDKSQLTNWKNLDPNLLNQAYDPGNQYSVPYMWGTAGIAWDSSKIKENITGWSDLWNPKYAGKIVVLDDDREVIGAALQLLGYSRNTTDSKQLAAAEAKLKELIPRVKAFDSDSPKTELLTGEAWIGLVWNGEAAIAMKEDPNIKFVIPKEGGSLWIDNMAIPKGAKHKDLAEKFINYLLEPEVSVELAKAYPYGLPNLAGKKLLPPEDQNNPVAYPSAADLARCEIIQDVGAATVEYDRIWTEVKGA